MSSTSNGKNSNNSQSPDDEWIGELIWTLVKAAGHLLWWAILFPALSVPVIVSGAVGIQFGGRAALVTSVVFIAAYVAWAWGDTKSFDAWVAAPVRRRWLTWWRYPRRWESVCTLHGLTANLGERHLVPVLRSVQIGQHTDVLELRVVTSQSVADWQKRTEALAAAWRADRLVVRAITPGEAAVTVMPGDVLAQPVALPAVKPGTTVDLAGVQVGVTETRAWWRVPLLGHHVLIAGATGAGKGRADCGR